MKNHTTKILATGIASAVLTNMSAPGANWVGGTDVFHEPTAWSTGTVPPSATPEDMIVANNNSHITANAATWTYLTNNSLLNSSTVYRGVDRLIMGGSPGVGRTMSFTLDIGNTNTFQYVQNATGFIGERNGNNATVTLDSGILEVGGTFTIGNNSTGALYIQGGTWRQGRNTLTVGNDSNATDPYTASGLVSISSGTLITRSGMVVGSGGTIQVLGSGATQIGIGSHSSGEGTFTLNGLLDMQIDAGGIKPIFVDDVDGTAGNHFATFNSGSLVDLDFLGTPAALGTWTLLELENGDITDNGIALAGGVDSGWSINVDNTGTNGLLLATYVPEPSTGILAGLAVLLGAGLRRRRTH